MVALMTDRQNDKRGVRVELVVSVVAAIAFLVIGLVMLSISAQAAPMVAVGMFLLAAIAVWRSVRGWRLLKSAPR